MMQELSWLDSHIGSLEDGVVLINRLHWNISVVEDKQNWAVKSGEKVIFCTDSREAIDAFLYGMALSYAVLPDDDIERYRAALDL